MLKLRDRSINNESISTNRDWSLKTSKEFILVQHCLWVLEETLTICSIYLVKKYDELDKLSKNITQFWQMLTQGTDAMILVLKLIDFDFQCFIKLRPIIGTEILKEYVTIANILIETITQQYFAVKEILENIQEEFKATMALFHETKETADHILETLSIVQNKELDETLSSLMISVRDENKINITDLLSQFKSMGMKCKEIMSENFQNFQRTIKQYEKARYDVIQIYSQSPKDEASAWYNWVVAYKQVHATDIAKIENLLLVRLDQTLQF